MLRTVFLLAALVVILLSPNLTAWGQYSPAGMYLKKGQQLQQIGDYAGAIDCYKKSLNAHPGDKLVHYYLGVAYEQSGNLQAAASEFRTVLNIDYNFVQARNDFGVVLKMQNNSEEAMQQFKSCIQINPKYPFAYYHLGTILQERGDIDGAIENYEAAAKLKPDYFDAQRDLGLAIFEKAKSGGTSVSLHDALPKLQIAAKLIPDNPMIHYDMALVYIDDGKLDEGEAELRRALMNDPRLAAARFQLSKLRYYRGDLDRCIIEAKETEKINPTYTNSKGYPKVDPIEVKVFIAGANELKGKLLEAVDAWKEISQMTNSGPIALKHVAEIEKVLRKEAKQNHSHNKKKLLTYDPEEIDALVTKGINQYDDGDLEGAKASFGRALELNPKSFEAMQNLAATQEALGDLNTAMATYQRALALKPEYDGAYYNLAYMLEKLNLPADAGNMYQTFHERTYAGKYPYDPRHIVELQQDDARRRAKEEQLRRRGY